MIDRLPPAGRRALALGLLLALVLLAVGLVAGPVWLARSGRAELESLGRRVAVLKERLPGREELIAEERLLGRAEGLERALLRGSTPAVAAAGLQGDLTALASAMGASVSSVQILDPEPAAPFTDVGLRLAMTADIGTVRDFLYAVETKEPVLVVRSFSLARGDGTGGEPVPGGTEPLTATLEVHGYLAVPVPPPAPGPAAATTATPAGG